MADYKLQWSQSGRTFGANNEDSATQVFDCVGYNTLNDALALFPIGYQYVENDKPQAPTTGSLLRLQRVNYKTIGTKHWVITCQFGVSETGGFKRQADGEDPLNKPTVWDWKPILESKPFDRDLQGNPIFNSAFDALSTPPTKPVTLWQLNLTKNFASFNLSSFAPYIQVANDGDIIYYQPDDSTLTIYDGNMLCEFVAPAAPYSDEMKYVPVTASFKIYMPDSIPAAPANVLAYNYHQLTFIDQGTNAYYGTYPNIKKGHLANEEDIVSRDALLNGKGKPLDTNLTVKDGTTSGQAPYEFTVSPSGATPITLSGLTGPYASVYYMRYNYWTRKKNLIPLLTLMGVA